MHLFYLIPSTVRFFKDLHLPRTIKNLQYLYKRNAIVYGIRCQISNMVYIGSTLTPGRRWHNHLVTGTGSNGALQAAIAKHGLSKFTAYVFEGDVKFPASCVSIEDKLAFLHKVEQTIINRFPKGQLYNEINSSNS